MGILEFLCDGKQWKRAVEYINNLVEWLIAMDNFDQWDIPGISVSDLVFALTSFGDALMSAEGNECCPDDDVFSEQCECRDCDIENCPDRQEEYRPWHCRWR